MFPVEALKRNIQSTVIRSKHCIKYVTFALLDRQFWKRCVDYPVFIIDFVCKYCFFFNLNLYVICFVIYFIIKNFKNYNKNGPAVPQKKMYLEIRLKFISQKVYSVHMSGTYLFIFVIENRAVRSFIIFIYLNLNFLLFFLSGKQQQAKKEK